PHDMSQQIMSQVLGQPRALGVTSGILALLGVIPGMPNFVFLAMAGVCAVGTYFLSKRPPPALKVAVTPAAQATTTEQKELSWDDVEAVDLIGLEVGYRLIPLVDRNQGGELMGRIKGVRKKLSEELGFLVQAVHIRDNLELGPNSYRITILGAPVGESEVFPDREMAINPGQVSGATIPGSATKDPAFGLDAVWIDKARREQAQAQGYTVVDASSVIATHLSHLLQSHAHELLGHEEVQQLLNRLGKTAPKLIEDLVPKLLPMSVVVKVQQVLHHFDDHAHRQELRHQIFDELGRGLAQSIQQLLHFFMAQQLVGMRLQQMAQVGGDDAAGVHHRVALRLRLLSPRLVDPDGIEAEGRILGGGSGYGRPGYLTRIDGHFPVGKYLGLAHRRAQNGDPVGVRAQFQIVANVHGLDQEAEFLRQFLAHSLDAPHEFAALIAVDQGNQAIANLQADQINRLDIVPGQFLLLGGCRLSGRRYRNLERRRRPLAQKVRAHGADSRHRQEYEIRHAGNDAEQRQDAAGHAERTRLPQHLRHDLLAHVVRAGNARHQDGDGH